MGLEANRRRPVTRAVSGRCAGFQNIHESVRALPGVDMSDAQIRDVRVAGSLRRARPFPLCPICISPLRLLCMLKIGHPRLLLSLYPDDVSAASC